MDMPTVFAEQMTEIRTVIHVLPDVVMRLGKDVELQEVFKAMPDVFPISDLRRTGADVSIPLSDIKAGEPQTLAAKLSVPPGPEGQFKLATVQIEDIPGTEVDIAVTYTTDERLLALENNAFPRGVFATAQTQVYTKAALSGDQTSLRKAEQMTETILKDPGLSSITTIRDAAAKIGDTVEKARSGLSADETKEAKEDMTQTQIWRPSEQ